MPKATSTPYVAVTTITATVFAVFAMFTLSAFLGATSGKEIESELAAIRWLILSYAVARFFGYLIKLPEA